MSGSLVAVPTLRVRRGVRIEIGNVGLDTTGIHIANLFHHRSVRPGCTLQCTHTHTEPIHVQKEGTKRRPHAHDYSFALTLASIFASSLLAGACGALPTPCPMASCMTLISDSIRALVMMNGRGMLLSNVRWAAGCTEPVETYELMSVARGLVEPGMRGMPFWSVSCSVEVRGRKRTRVRGSSEALGPRGRR